MGGHVPTPGTAEHRRRQRPRLQIEMSRAPPRRWYGGFSAGLGPQPLLRSRICHGSSHLKGPAILPYPQFPRSTREGMSTISYSSTVAGFSPSWTCSSPQLLFARLVTPVALLCAAAACHATAPRRPKRRLLLFQRDGPASWSPPAGGHLLGRRASAPKWLLQWLPREGRVR